MRRKYCGEQFKKMEVECMNFINSKASKFPNESAFLDNLVGYINRVYVSNEVPAASDGD